MQRAKKNQYLLLLNTVCLHTLFFKSFERQDSSADLGTLSCFCLFM